MNTYTPSSHCARPIARQRFGRNRPGQRGYSIIELSIALAILAVIIIGGLLGVQIILRNNNTNNMLKNIPLVAANVTKLTSSLSVLDATVNSNNLANLGVWPPAMVTGGVTARVVTNEHGGVNFIEANTLASGTYAIGQTFLITLTGIPQASCADVVGGVDGLSTAIGVTSVTPAAAVTATPAGPALVKATGGAIAIGTLATACGATGLKSITAVIAR
ncbi:type II secretion system protein [Actimicrobium sp. CCI2.3]|uniref:type II secretion system protein n=1 Tax=Actimicrobium sp. CCI2.3 TaxID=3048616 RepID=UPI002AB49C41|nr:type 4 pilus major pilin [Actimicrobium sp. CCI2.3]MDY7574210.1 type 4 pilus major pilin [Actimicrobium sp. CCI2.3]MEB0023867.1 type 4 pilus major pilin [Actimicrobium sp. CCI2.3]